MLALPWGGLVVDWYGCKDVVCWCSVGGQSVLVLLVLWSELASYWLGGLVVLVVLVLWSELASYWLGGWLLPMILVSCYWLGGTVLLVMLAVLFFGGFYWGRSGPGGFWVGCSLS